MSSAIHDGWFDGFRGVLRDLEQRSPAEVPPLERYEIVGVLGEGAAARVYRARDRELNRPVAVKILREPLGTSDTACERFQRESRTAALLAHPNVVAIYDAGVHEGRPFLVMELVDGRPLNELLKQRPVDLPSLVRLLEKVGRGLSVAHERGIVHRDIKPANILVTAEGEPKVGDFGLAHVAGSEAALTRSGSVLGTPLYMSPEQVRGSVGLISPRTDVYALGAILYEALTGHPPHTGDSVTEIYGKIVDHEPALPRALNPSAPSDLQTICLKSLEKEPERRYPTAREFADDLRRYLDGESILARPPGLASRSAKWIRRHRLAAAIITAAVLILASASWGFSVWLEAREKERRREARMEGEREAASRFAASWHAVESAVNALYSDDGDWNEAVRLVDRTMPLIDEGIRLAPHLATGYHLRGRAWKVMGEEARAEKDFREAVRLDPGFSEAHFELGRLLLARSLMKLLGAFKNQEEEAKEESQRVAKEAAAEFERATLSPSARNNELQLASAKTALAACREDFGPLMEMAAAGLARFEGQRGAEDFHFYMGLGSPQDRKIPHFDLALKKCPNHSLALFARATVYLHTPGGADPAIRDLTRLIHLEPKSQAACLGLAMAWSDKKDYGRALGALDELLRLNPDSIIGLVWRHRVHREMGDLPASIRDLDRTIELGPRRYRRYLLRAPLRHRVGDKKGAAEDLEKVLDLAPPDHAMRETWTRDLENIRKELEKDH